MDHSELIEESLVQLSNNEYATHDNLLSAYRLFSFIIELFTENEAIGFTTLFSRIAFLSVKKRIQGDLLSQSHYLRRKIESQSVKSSEIQSLYDLCLFLCNELESIRRGSPTSLKKECPSIFEDLRSAPTRFRRVYRGILSSVDSDQMTCSFIPEEQPDKSLQVNFSSPSVFNHVLAICKFIPLPVLSNLIDVELAKGDSVIAKAIVFCPDLLIGVTSVSECFQSSGYTSLKYLSRKLIPSDNSLPMMLGNIVNYYLDELIHNPELQFENVLSTTFQLTPIFFASMENEDLKDMLVKLKLHFTNLKRVIKEDLDKAKIYKEKAYLEPSFLSNEYGLQGRLDLYHYNEQESQSDIIELKSGKLFKANAYGLNANHYVQTLLYDLVVESAFQNKIKSNNYILYSSLDNKNLKYAPKVRAQQLEAVKVRNEIIAIEYILCNLSDEKHQKFLEFLDPKKIDDSFTFLKRDSKKIFQVFSLLSELEKAYYLEFLSFISREFKMAKLGQHGIHTTNGLASLWLDPINEKIENFTILSHLEIAALHSDSEDPLIELRFSKGSNRLSRFRLGDIAVFYPHKDTTKAPLRNQIFKCTIVDMFDDGLTIRLRARQKNSEIFEQHPLWNIEGDVLDGGFNQQLHGLFQFADAPEDYRERILGQRAPYKPVDKVRYDNKMLTAEQNEIVRAAIDSSEYYLLWGPPGTGKTSVILKSLTEYYFQKTDANILLLAYTNRAVDEICAAVETSIDGQFIRIGSRYSVHPRYKDKLLSKKTGTLKTRRELLDLFKEHRVFISTISSFQGKKELSRIKKFDLVIVDEGSQLLEPMLVGLLSSFKKFILIGDHKQLPAITTQPEFKKMTSSKILRERMEVSDLSISFFERLYRQCEKNNWNWAYGRLTQQGRMHEDILKFSSGIFYNSELVILNHIKRLKEEYQVSTETKLERLITEQRFIFIDTPISDSPVFKTHEQEAELTFSLLSLWKKVYDQNEKQITDTTFGVITPFRSQIALIKEKLKSDTTLKNQITVDTIERYQGGARDHIIISLAINRANLLGSISNVSNEGIDRKLNVALTRAKEHLIVLGNKEILQRDPTYAALIEYAYNLNLEV